MNNTEHSNGRRPDLSEILEGLAKVLTGRIPMSDQEYELRSFLTSSRRAWTTVVLRIQESIATVEKNRLTKRSGALVAAVDELVKLSGDWSTSTTVSHSS